MRRAPGPPVNAHVGCAFVIMFITGTFFALSVFNRPLERLNEAAFGDGVLLRAIGILPIVLAPSMTAASLYLEYELPGTTKSTRIRHMSLLGIASLAVFYVACVAAHYALPWMLASAIALLGVPCGLFYLLGVELAALWSTNVGFGIGATMASSAAGSIFASMAFELGIAAVGIEGALAITATVWVVVGSVCLPWLTWPDVSPDLEVRESSQSGNRLSWLELLGSPPLYFCSFSAFAGQSAYGPLYAYFFSASYQFSDVNRPTSWFAAMQLVAVVARLAAGLLAEIVGAQRLLLIILCAQTAAFGLLSAFESYVGFLVGALVLFCCFNAFASDMGMLCRDLFSPANAPKVYGAVCGLPVGFGQAFSVALFSLVGGSFRRYYVCLGVLSGLGALSGSMMQRESKAFREAPESFEASLGAADRAVEIDEKQPLVVPRLRRPGYLGQVKLEVGDDAALGSCKGDLVIHSPKFTTLSRELSSTPQGFGSVSSYLEVS